MENKVIANTITLTRLLLTFVVIAFFGNHDTLDIGLIFTIAFIFILDALDGIVARQRNETSKLGEVLDTLTDRIVENTFWIYFAVTGRIPLWVPIAVMVRGLLTDNLKGFWGYPTHGWTHALTRTRMSRGVYGAVKMIAFMSLASVSVFNNHPFENASRLLAALAVGFCFLRGFPFFFIRKRSCPRST